MPRVSVLLTCYNHLKFLPAAFDSIRSQTFQDIEIIIIDDGSHDGSRDWITENCAECKIIFNKKNLGTYASLNVALASSTGEFVAILNDDDLWMPRKIETEVAVLDALPNVGLVHTDGHFVDGSGNKLEGSPLGFEFPRTETGDVLIPLVYANKIIASSVLVRRSCFDDLGGFDPQYFGSGDWNMWLRIAEKHEIGYVNEPLTMYRVHGENASHKHERIWKDDQILREWIEAQFSRFLESGRDPKALALARAHNWACLGTVRTLNGNPAAGRQAYVEALRYQPLRAKTYLRILATYLHPQVFRRLN